MSQRAKVADTAQSMFPDGVTKNDVSPETDLMTTLGVLAGGVEPAGVPAGAVVPGGATVGVAMGVRPLPPTAPPLPEPVELQAARASSNVPANRAGVRGREMDMRASILTGPYCAPLPTQTAAS